MYSAALCELSIDSKEVSIPSLAKKHGVPKEKLSTYRSLLAQLPSATPNSVWTQEEIAFISHYIKDAAGEFDKKFDVYESAATFLKGRSGHSVRLYYSRYIKIPNTKIVLPTTETPSRNNIKEQGEGLLEQIQILRTAYHEKEKELEFLKSEMSELAVKVIELDERQQKLVKVQKRAKKLEKSTIQQNNEVKKRTKAILNYKAFGGVIEVK